MSSATLNIKVAPRRMLSEREAAEYCGIPTKHFRASCLISPVEISRGRFMFDMRDLDAWIDGLKAGSSDGDADILNRL